ncbi:peptidase S8, partial [Methylobacterium radiotolerans]
MFRHLGAERRLRDLGDCSARVLGGERTSPSHHALIVCCSLVVLITALGPVAAQTIPARSPSTLDVFGAPLAAAQFDTTEYRADWGSAKINAATAYARGFTGLGVMVAVVDSGIDPTHPEFHNTISPLSRNFINGFRPYTLVDTDKNNDHGTHVSGTIGAGRNSYGMMGVAFDSTILSLPTIFKETETSAAINYAATVGARVLNGSYGPGYSKPFNPDGTVNYRYRYLDSQEYNQDRSILDYHAIVNATKKDVLLVFTAGNDGIYQPKLAANPEGNALLPFIKPSNSGSNIYTFEDENGTIVTSSVDFSGVSGYIVAVVATDINNNLADFSNRCGVAASWCLAAPGVDILSTDVGGYRVLSGTSMAAPHVSGAAAVLRQAFPFLTAPQIAQTMFTTATHLGDGPTDRPNSVFGWGLLNLGKAIDGPGQFTSDWTVNTTYNGQAYYGRFGNDISGVGGLTKTGLGTLELAGRDTYAGPTTVAGGTLILSATGSLTSPVSVQGAGTYINAGWTQSSVSNAGLLINTGAITGGVANTGLLATSGTISGGLTNAGTVLASAGRIDGPIANNAGLLAVAGSVAGTGPFANAAGATLAVTTGGSYSLAGPLANAGLVAVAQSASLTASGGLSNAGLVASDGTLTTDLTNTGIARLSGQFNGTLTNTGLVQITGPLAGLTSLTNTGALDLGGTAFTLTDLAGPASAVLGNGALTVSNAAASTYAGAILETASPTSLTKAGPGTLLLTGLGLFSGPTTIQAGTLSLNGLWTSPVTVAANGTLRGIGTVAAPVTVAGALRPGNSPGTLTVLGPVAFAPGSSLGLDIDGPGTGTGAGSYARLLALGPTGTVSANGTLVPELRGITGNAGNSFTPALGQRFGVLTAQAGLSGSFSGLAQPAAGLPAGTRFDALYAATGLDLVVTPAAYGNLAGLGLAQTGNARAVGAALDLARPAAGTRPDAARARVYDPLYVADPATLPGGLASLSGQSYGDAVMTDLAARRLLSDTIDRHQRGLGGGAGAFSAGDPGPGPNRTALQVRGGAGAAAAPLAVGEGRVWADALYGFGARAGDRA